MLEKFLEEYVEKLYYNQNLTSVEEQKNLYSKKDYYEILKPVVDLINKNDSYSIDSLTNLSFFTFSS